jgi:hypothetical protein
VGTAENGNPSSLGTSPSSAKKPFMIFLLIPLDTPNSFYPIFYKNAEIISFHHAAHLFLKLSSVKCLKVCLSNSIMNAVIQKQKDNPCQLW